MINEDGQHQVRPHPSQKVKEVGVVQSHPVEISIDRFRFSEVKYAIPETRWIVQRPLVDLTQLIFKLLNVAWNIIDRATHQEKCYRKAVYDGPDLSQSTAPCAECQDKPRHHRSYHN